MLLQQLPPVYLEFVLDGSGTSYYGLNPQVGQHLVTCLSQSRILVKKVPRDHRQLLLSLRFVRDPKLKCWMMGMVSLHFRAFHR